jgi:tetratricopeptide (TPR) repeat protein
VVNATIAVEDEGSGEPRKIAKLLTSSDGSFSLSVPYLTGKQGFLKGDQQRYEQAAACFRESLQISRTMGWRDLEATVVGNLGRLTHLQGDWTTAKQRYTEALRLFPEVGRIRRAVATQNNLCLIALQEGNLEAARRWSTEALQGERELGDKLRIAWALGTAGDVALRTGALEESQRLIEESLILARDLDARRQISQALVTLWDIARRMGRLDEARKRLREAVRLARDGGHIFTELDSLRNVASLAESEGQEARAVRLKAAETAERARAHLPPDAFYLTAGEEMSARLRASLGEEQFAIAWAEGEHMTLEEALAHALDEHATVRAKDSASDRIVSSQHPG